MKIVFSFIIITLLSCSSAKEYSEVLPYEVESAYFQQWIGGQEQTGSGINFYLKFKNALPENTTLTKLYFQNKEASFDKENETTFVARFYTKPQDKALILHEDSAKEYGNKAPEMIDRRFKLQNNEAMLEFHIGNKINHYKLVDIKEKELLAYPSTRPRN
jgi:hypothetical protein